MTRSVFFHDFYLISQYTVFILVASGDLLRKILLDAHDLGMGNGDYAFLGVELVKTRSSSSESSWYRPGDKRNKEAREMFESLLMIAVRVPTSVQYTSFVHDVVKKSTAEFGRGVTEADVSTLSETKNREYKVLISRHVSSHTTRLIPRIGKRLHLITRLVQRLNDRKEDSFFVHY